MSSPQKRVVNSKVNYVGLARCDLCEAMRAECVAVPAGFFGATVLTVCKECTVLIVDRFSDTLPNL